MAEHEEAARKKPRQVTGPDMERMAQLIAMVQDSGRCPSPAEDKQEGRLANWLLWIKARPRCPSREPRPRLRRGITAPGRRADGRLCVAGGEGMFRCRRSWEVIQGSKEAPLARRCFPAETEAEDQQNPSQHRAGVGR
jgi:hypothetical protein